MVGPEADVPSLAEVADGLDPAEDLLDACAHTLADGVADVPRRPAVDVRASLLGDILRDVWQDVALAAVLDATSIWRSSTKPLRFSMSACAEYESFASFPLPVRASLALGSVVELT